MRNNKQVLENAVLGCRKRDGDGPAMSAAVLFGLNEVVGSFLAEGIDPNIKVNSRNGTPLMSCNHPRVGKLLLEYGAEVKARDDEGNTPLIWFLRGPYEKKQARVYLKWLLSVGADPNDVASDGKSARDIAKQKFDLDLDELM